MTHFIELHSCLDGLPILTNIDSISQIFRSRDHIDCVEIYFKDGKRGLVLDNYDKIKEQIIKYTENANAD